MARTPSAEYLILDIETVPDSERWSRPETSHGEPAFPPTWAHRIIVIGYLWLDHNYRFKQLGVAGAASAAASDDARERGLLDEFSQLVGRARPVLVTYNGSLLAKLEKVLSVTIARRHPFICAVEYFQCSSLAVFSIGACYCFY